jgi:hypothetical protein
MISFATPARISAVKPPACFMPSFVARHIFGSRTLSRKAQVSLRAANWPDMSRIEQSAVDEKHHVTGNLLVRAASDAESLGLLAIIASLIMWMRSTRSERRLLRARSGNNAQGMRLSDDRPPRSTVATKLDNRFPGDGNTAYLKNGGTLENASQPANHTSMRTTQLYDTRREELSGEEVERIRA